MIHNDSPEEEEEEEGVTGEKNERGMCRPASTQHTHTVSGHSTQV